MKTLAELRLEVELGLTAYNSTNHDVDVFFAEGWYIWPVMTPYGWKPRASTDFHRWYVIPYQ